jgi:hypothetical protein
MNAFIQSPCKWEQGRGEHEWRLDTSRISFTRSAPAPSLRASSIASLELLGNANASCGNFAIFFRARLELRQLFATCIIRGTLDLSIEYVTICECVSRVTFASSINSTAHSVLDCCDMRMADAKIENFFL